MVSFVRMIRSMDGYKRTSEDYKIRTFSGAIVTLVAVFLILIFSISETMSYLSVQKSSKLIIDNPNEEKLKITFDVTFPSLPCSFISLDAMDASGNHQLDIDQNVSTTRISPSGRRLDSISRIVKAIQRDSNYCGACYGSEDEERKCCNSCEDVQEQYRKKGWTFKPEKITQCVEEKFVDNLKNQKDEGCQLTGYFMVNKVRGNFHVAVGRAVSTEHGHMHDTEMFMFMNFFNLSHNINELSFGEQFPGQINVLNGEKMIWTSNESAMYQYHFKIIPTEYEYLNGKRVISNQYSVTESSRSISQSSHKGLPGVFFMYDLSPLVVKFKETRQSFGHYLTSLCVIIGGIFTVAGLIENLLYKSLVQRKKVETKGH